MLLFLLVVLAAVAFEYINGFHDAANAIATVVSTKVLTPRQAIALAAFFNLTGALMGTAVASTIGKGIVDLKVVTMRTILCALLGAIVWNLATWLLGLPSSSSHALIGGLCGAALAASGGDFGVLKWGSGLIPKVIVPMVTSPVIGFLVGGLLMFVLLLTLQSFTPHLVHKVFGKLQLVSAAWMATPRKPWASSRSRFSPAPPMALSLGSRPPCISCAPRFLRSPCGLSCSARERWRPAPRRAAGASFARSAIRW